MNSGSVCAHLAEIKALADANGARISSAGMLWSKNCRYWIHYDAYFDKRAIRKELKLAPCVQDHEHLGTHDGRESGFYCTECHDGVIGVHPKDRSGKLCIR